jgi:hypothetical protein
MGILLNVSKFVFDRASDFETRFNAAQPKIQNGTYTVNQFFTDTTSFWSNAMNDLGEIFPSVPADTVPVTFKTIGASANAFSELVNPGFYPAAAALTDTGLLPLTGGAGKGGASNIVAQADGTLQVNIPGITGQKSGELYQDIVFYADGAGKVHPVVVLVIKVT